MSNARLGRTVAERLRKKIAATKSPTGEAVTVSIGITDNTDHPDNLKILLERADIALYKAKNQGRNRTVIETSLKINVLA
ncbi:diguanylate cyclase [Paenibacillus sp. N3.4]|uniref:diguanylate cyclase n=1 Tax=Paenibacillus sp. N3.4 TaxID=2603222 RepID=UPI0021C45003|nr:diguanylate cyclase [Paenibacillus sp. N3.4]